MNVWNKLEANAYRNPVPFPASPRKPRLNMKASPAEVRAYADELEAYDVAMVRYREEVAAYYARNVALEAEFRHDLELEYHMVGHPKADLLYGKAWERGHSGGLQEVASAYSDMVDLVL